MGDFVSSVDKQSSVKASQQLTRAYNYRLVLRTIYDRGLPASSHGSGQISRADVARVTGLSRTTVSDIVSDLLAQNLVEEVGFGISSGGKNPILLKVRADARHLIGIDLSGDEFRGEVVNLRGETQGAVSLPLSGRSGQSAMDLVYCLIDQLLPAATAPMLGLGVGTPGLIDAERGSQVHWSVNLDWLDMPLRDLLEARYQLPVSVLNDCQASALAEHFFGPAQRSSNLVLIKSEQGVGSGVILNGQLFHGDNFGAGEIGHVVVDPDGPPCRCGNRGCLETLASVSAVVERARVAAAAAGGTLRANSRSRAQRPLTIDLVRRALQSGDPAIRQVVHDAGRALGIAIANLVGALNVRRIVIAGGIAELGPELLNVINEEVLRRSLTALARETEVAFSTLGSRITILGASAAQLQQELGVTPFREHA
jgi:predicted NBD/HSP70 family sugar kinase